MYPIGHCSIAIAFRKKSKGLLFLTFCCFLTILPDFDLLLGIIHRTITHSILFALIIGLIISRKNWYYFSGLIISHPLLDMVCQDAPRNGVQFFWPINHYYQFPFHPFPATPIIPSLGTEFLFGILIYWVVFVYKKVIIEYKKIKEFYGN